MKLRRAGIVLFILSFALAVPSQTTAVQGNLGPESEVTTYQFATDSTFEVEPSVVYGENRTSFSHWYEQDFQGGDRNVVCLNWTHQAGVSYNYSEIPPTYSGLEYADYVALRIPLAYPYNVTPLGFKGSFEARLLAAGDLAVNDWCASVEVYLVTEAGDWHYVPFDHPAANDDTFSSYSSVASRQFLEYWASDFGGVTPVDLGTTFDVVLLLAPSHYFAFYENGGWKTMSGTVVLEVCGFSAEVLLYNPTRVQALQPYRGERLNVTSAWPRGSITTDPSGASYSLFEAFSLTDGSVTYFVVKWNRELRIVCNRTLDIPHVYYAGIHYSGGHLYCYGQLYHQTNEESALLVCTDLEANVLWFREYHFGTSASAMTAGTGEDESILLTGLSSDGDGMRYSWVMGVLPDGTPILNATFSSETTDIYQICGVHEQRVYGVTYGSNPVCYSLDGDLLWRGNATCDRMTVGPEGHIYAWESKYSGGPVWCTGYSLFRYDSGGILLWNRTLEVTYPGGWADSLSLVTFAVRSDGRLLATFIIYRFLYRVIIYSVSADGQSEVARTLFDSTPYGSADFEAPLLMRGLDSCFLVLTHSYSGSGNYLYTMLSYQNSVLVPAEYSLLTVLSTASAAVLLAGWVLYDRVGRQRLSYRPRRNIETGS